MTHEQSTPRGANKPPSLDQTMNLGPETFAVLKAQLSPEVQAAFEAISNLPPKTPETAEQKFAGQIANVRQEFIDEKQINQAQIEQDQVKLKNPVSRTMHGLTDPALNQQSDKSLIQNIHNSEKKVLLAGIALAYLHFSQAKNLKGLTSQLKLDQEVIAQELRQAWEVSEVEKRSTSAVSEKSKAVLENIRLRAAALDRLSLLIKRETV